MTILEQPQDRGVEGLVEVGYELVRPVHGQIVLDEVVRPDAEVIHFLDQDVGHGRRRRDLDHDPERHAPDRKGSSRPRAPLGPRRKRALISPISSISVIIGMMIRMFSGTLARRMARSWIRNRSRCRSEKRIARRPRAGIRLLLDLQAGAGLFSPPMSIVRM